MNFHILCSMLRTLILEAVRTNSIWLIWKIHCACKFFKRLRQYILSFKQ